MSDTSAPATAAPSAPSAQPAPAPATVVTPGSKAWAELTPDQRHAQLRGPENPRARGHSPARDQREAAAQKVAGTPTQAEWLRMTPEQRAEHTRAAAASQSAPPSPDAPATSAEKVKIGKFEVSEGEIAAMMDRQAQDDLRKATVPPSPDAYELKISPDAKLPGDMQFQFDGNDPSMVAARNWAHSKGLDQSAFSEMITLYASHVAGQETMLAERSRAEIAKAGVNAPQRVDAIGKWIRAEVGDADAKPILASMVTDAHLRFYEKMQHRITSQGVTPFSQSHRVAPDTDTIPGFDKMDYAHRRLAQDQLAARRNGR
jgi:hypothetical protein